METVKEQDTIVAAGVIEPPVVTELGSITALTLGKAKDDTADMKKYYY